MVKNAISIPHTRKCSKDLRRTHIFLRMFDNTACLHKLDIKFCTYRSSVNHLSGSRRGGNISMISVTKLFFFVHSLTLLQLSIGCSPVADPSKSNHIVIRK